MPDMPAPVTRAVFRTLVVVAFGCCLGQDFAAFPGRPEPAGPARAEARGYACECRAGLQARRGLRPGGYMLPPFQPPTPSGQPQPRPPRPGVSTPGVKIPMARLKPEAVFEIPGVPDWIAIDEHVWISNKPKDSVTRIDPKTNTIVATIAAGSRPCSGLAAGLGSVWVPNCGDPKAATGGEPGLTRIDLKSGKPLATIRTGIAHTEGGVAVGAGSVWLLTDAKGTLARFDPATNAVVTEIYVTPGSYAVAFGEGAAWVTCTDKSLLTRIDPHTNLIVETIPVGPSPRFLAVGEGSVWTLNQGDGSVSRVDVKTNKVVATIEVGVPGGGGEIAVGEGSVWVTSFAFPISRIDPATNKVVQQFFGEGGDAIRVGHGSVWLSNLRQQNVWRLDPRRIEATQ
jgi:YVTN family beta-propeller protein